MNESQPDDINYSSDFDESKKDSSLKIEQKTCEELLNDAMNDDSAK